MICWLRRGPGVLDSAVTERVLSPVLHAPILLLSPARLTHTRNVTHRCRLPLFRRNLKLLESLHGGSYTNAATQCYCAVPEARRLDSCLRMHLVYHMGTGHSTDASIQCCPLLPQQCRDLCRPDLRVHDTLHESATIVILDIALPPAMPYTGCGPRSRLAKKS